MTERSLYDELDEAADQLPAGAGFETYQALFREIRQPRFPGLSPADWRDALEVWSMRYASREVLRRDARYKGLEALALELVTTPPGEKRNALAASAARLYGPQRPDPPAEATWVDG